MSAFVFATDADCPLVVWLSCAQIDRPHAWLGSSQLLPQSGLYFLGAPCFGLLFSISIYPFSDSFFPSLSLRSKGEGQPSKCSLCESSLPANP